MSERMVGVIGATSFVGHVLLTELAKRMDRVIAFSRRNIPQTDTNITWRQYHEGQGTASDWDPLPAEAPIASWICVAPIYILPQYFELMQVCGVKRLVALSSTSLFTKSHSLEVEEQQLAKQMADAEEKLQRWAEQNRVEWVILRPTLIYGQGLDKNISEIIRLIRRFGFFPVFGSAKGMRQPVHVKDVAQACLAAMESPVAANHAYNISGSEVLSYREMVRRIFAAMGREPRLLNVPLWLFQFATALLRLLPRYRRWNVAMAERMNRDMVFDHTDAKRDLGFRPQPFDLTAQDIPN